MKATIIAVSITAILIIGAAWSFGASISKQVQVSVMVLEDNSVKNSVMVSTTATRTVIGKDGKPHKIKTVTYLNQK